MNDGVLVLGYNNTRVNDVKKIRTKCKDILGSLTILCKKDPTKEDEEACDATINVGLEASQENLDIIIEKCRDL